MKRFNGFPAKMEFTSLPNYFFSTLLPQINDMAELKTTLCILAVLYRKQGYPRFVTYGELLGNSGLTSSLRDSAMRPEEALFGALKSATERGTFLHLILHRGQRT